MRLFAATLLVFVPLTHATETENPGDNILGRWFTVDREAQIEIHREDDDNNRPVYHGKIIWLADPFYRGEGPEYGHPLRDANNPEDSRQHEPILGLTLLTGMEYNEKKKRWQDGRIYDPESGNKYRATIKRRVDKDGQETLVIRGYVLIRLIGRNTTWTRVPEDFIAPDPPPQFPGKSPGTVVP